MKKLLLVICTFFGLINLNAQATLEKSYSCTFDTIAIYAVDQVSENIGGKYSKYIAINANDRTLKLYDLSHNLLKTSTFSVPAGYRLNTFANTSTHLFNMDDKVELTLVFYNSTSSSYLVKLINEDGTELYDFGNVYYASAIVGQDNYFRLKTYFSKSVYDAESKKTITTTEYKIYKLDGIVPTSFRSATVNKQETAFPIPASDIVNIPYRLNQGESDVVYIYSQAGLLITSKFIDSSSEILLLDVSAYPSGVYTYRYKSGGSQFVVK